MSAVEKSDKKLIEPSDLGLACLSATAPSVFVKIRSPNDPPHRLGHPHGQKNLLRSPRLTFFSRLPNFDQNIKFIHSGVGSVVSCWDKKANNNFLCLCLAETGHWHKRTTSMKQRQEGHNNNKIRILHDLEWNLDCWESEGHWHESQYWADAGSFDWDAKLTIAARLTTFRVMIRSARLLMCLKLPKIGHYPLFRSSGAPSGMFWGGSLS